jgi:hypothetical protein
VPLASLRSRERLNWRYADHPVFTYKMVELRGEAAGQLRGIAVTRRGGIAADVLMLMDWLVPGDDLEACHRLLDAVARQASEMRAGAVVAWFPEGSEWFARFQDLGFRVRPTPIILVGRSWDREIPIERIRHELHLTLGDIEYY